MKHSIKRQMTAVFIGLVLCLIMAFLVINLNFLEPYYISNKETQFIYIYEQLRAAVEEREFSDDEVSDRIYHMAEKNNVSFLVVNDNSGMLISNVKDMAMLRNQLTGYIVNQTQEETKALQRTENYQLTQSKDPWNKIEYIEMWGKFEDGSLFLLRSPLESIKESVAIFNRFLFSIGSVIMVICIAFIWYFSKRMTDPILELAALSERMVNLDFNAKYTSGGSNEIGELGANFNRMSEKLESVISELKSANNSLQKDIERKEKLEQMRSEFMGNVSHELKTPIALIQGYAEGLKEGVNESEESREFYCDVIIDEAAKMNQMVRNLMTLNQLEFGDEELSYERFDLTQLIREVLKSMEILAQQKEAKVIFRQEEAVYVWGDEFKVEQVVRNYVSNAYNHLDGECVVEVKVLLQDGKAKVIVFNTGTPIPEEEVPHIWDKFYKVDKAHTREYGGNGIGLSIVKAIMESFHQKYGVNNYDNGVEFWFEIDTE